MIINVIDNGLLMIEDEINHGHEIAASCKKSFFIDQQ